MLPEESDLALLWDMLDAAQAIQQFSAGRSFDDYLHDRMLRGAVERHLEIIGEAARKVSTRFREANPEIPWRSIIAQRNVLAHEYGEVKHELVWKLVVVHIPALATMIEPFIPPSVDNPRT